MLVDTKAQTIQYYLNGVREGTSIDISWVQKDQLHVFCLLGEDGRVRLQYAGTKSPSQASDS